MKRFIQGCAYNESIGAFDVVNNNKATVYSLESAAEKVLEYLDDVEVESVFVFLPNCEEVEFDVNDFWNTHKIIAKLKTYMQRNRNY